MEINHQSPRVLIIKPSSLGDIIHAFPAMDILLSHYPGAVIDWLVNPAFADALQYCRNIGRIIIFPRRELADTAKFPSAFAGLIRQLRINRYELVIDMQGLLRSAFFGRLARGRRFAGFARPKETTARFFYKEIHQVSDASIHAVERNCELVSRILGVPPQQPVLRPLPERPEPAGRAAALLRQHGIDPGTPLAGVVPGARWKSKQWPEEFFATTIRQTAQAAPELKFVVLGSKSESETAGRIVDAAAMPDKVVSLAGQTGLSELFEIIRNCRCLLSNDSGPMHIAAALAVPVLALFGPTVPEKTGPYGSRHTVIQPELSCIKCLKRRCPEGTDACHRMICPNLTATKIVQTIKMGTCDESKM